MESVALLENVTEELPALMCGNRVNVNSVGLFLKEHLIVTINIKITSQNEHYSEK